MASSQGSNSYAVFDRVSNKYKGSFKIDAGNGIDEVTETDGIDVTNTDFGPLFPKGFFIAQDGTNNGQNQNFKLVSWQRIANSLDLAIDTRWDPRLQ